MSLERIQNVTYYQSTLTFERESAVHFCEEEVQYLLSSQQAIEYGAPLIETYTSYLPDRGKAPWVIVVYTRRPLLLVTQSDLQSCDPYSVLFNVPVKEGAHSDLC